MASVELENSRIDNRPVDSDEAYLRAQARPVEQDEALADPHLGSFAEERVVRRKITRRPVK
jgi:hypothetical protein